MSWYRYIRYLVVALDMQEQEDFRYWVLAQQDPKKFHWSSANTSQPNVAHKVLQFAKEKLGAKNLVKSDIWEYADGKLPMVFRAKVFDSDTGQFLREAWVDKDGKEVNVNGLTTKVVESHHPLSKEAALKAFGLG
jgi:hypothetical protein